MHTPALATLFALGAALLLVPACQSGGGDTTGLKSGGFPAPDKSLVYAAAEDALRQQGFTPDSSVSSEAQGVVISRHKLVLAPFSGQGYREKATVRIAEMPERPSYYTVEVNVLRDPNNNISEPSNPIAAEWGGGIRVPELESLIKSRIEMRFSAPGASPAFRKERGLSPSPPAERLGGATGPAPGYKR